MKLSELEIEIYFFKHSDEVSNENYGIELFNRSSLAMKNTKCANPEGSGEGFAQSLEETDKDGRR